MEDSYLIISDLDGTLLGDDAALDKFAQWIDERRERIRLVYSSGRLTSSILDSVETTALPKPDAIIGGVGTQIREFPSDAPFRNWPEPCHNWQPEQIRCLLAEDSDLSLQPAEFQADHKISYFLYDAAEERVAEIAQRLSDSIQVEVELVYSSNRDLDVLPSGVNKGTAAGYLASQWSYPNEQVIVCGDSGNDLAMFQQGFRGIVVGNAHPQLKSLDSPVVFQAENDYAGGVLEGLVKLVG